jgi:hypothetical protein
MGEVYFGVCHFITLFGLTCVDAALVLSFLRFLPTETAAMMIEKTSSAGNGQHACRNKGITQ